MRNRCSGTFRDSSRRKANCIRGPGNSRNFPFIETFKNIVRHWKNGAPGTIRTSDPQIRSLMLYPAELRARRHFMGAGSKAAPRRRLPLKASGARRQGFRGFGREARIGERSSPRPEKFCEFFDPPPRGGWEAPESRRETNSAVKGRGDRGRRGFRPGFRPPRARGRRRGPHNRRRWRRAPRQPCGAGRRAAAGGRSPG